MDYHNLRRRALGYALALLAAPSIIGCTQIPYHHRPTGNPLINDTVDIDKYLVKSRESGKPKIITAGSLEQEAKETQKEEASTYAPGSSPLIITSKKTKKRQPVITDLVADADINAEFSELRGTARLLIEPSKDWRINPSIKSRWAVKHYDDGRNLEVQSANAGISIGKYIHGLESLFGPDAHAYAELGLNGEVNKYLNRTSRIDSNVLFNLGLGLFAPKSRTRITAFLGAGPGKYEIDDKTVQKEDQYLRILADLQLKQAIFKGLYARGRANLSLRNYKEWADTTFLSLETGFGWEEKKFLGMPRAFVEALFTFRNELHEYFNHTQRQEDVLGIMLKAGAQLTNNVAIEAGIKWDEELLLGMIAQIVLRY